MFLFFFVFVFILFLAVDMTTHTLFKACKDPWQLSIGCERLKMKSGKVLLAQEKFI